MSSQASPALTSLTGARSLVRRRPGSPYWHYDWRIAGKRVRGSTGSTDYGEAVERALATRQRLASIARNAPRGPIREMTLRSAARRYHREHGAALASAADVKNHLRHLARFFGADTPLSEIDRDRVRAFVERRRREVAPGTVNRNLSTLRRLLRTAHEDWGAAVSDVKVRRLMLPEPRGRDVFLSYAQAERLIAAIIPHARPIIRLTLFTGLRRGNLWRLTWDQVDLEGRQLRVRVKDRHRQGKPHAVPLIDEAIELLRSVAPAPEDRIGPVFAYGNPHLQCGCPSCNRRDLRGRPIKDIKRAFNTARKAIGMPEVRFHDLRHTVASWLLQKGYPLKWVKDILGHADMRTTERYSHLEHRHLAGAMREALGRDAPKGTDAGA